jgi:CheY-like chemotaxis protein
VNNHGVVLLVEDDANDVFLMQRACRKVELPNPLQVVGDGDEAVDYLSGAGRFADRAQYPLPALVLLDLKLPRKTGLEVLEWLRQQSALRRVPVVVLTSSKEPADVNKAYDLGANSYLVKPLGFDALLELVRSLNIYWLNMNEKAELRPV